MTPHKFDNKSAKESIENSGKQPHCASTTHANLPVSKVLIFNFLFAVLSMFRRCEQMRGGQGGIKKGVTSIKQWSVMIGSVLLSGLNPSLGGYVWHSPLSLSTVVAKGCFCSSRWNLLRAKGACGWGKI